MSFRRMIRKTNLFRECVLGVWLITGLGQGAPVWPSIPQEVVDRIVALVNDEVIVLSDVDVVTAFGLVSDALPPAGEVGFDRVLDEIISRKVVLQFTHEASPIEENTLEVFRDEIIARMGVARFREELERFGMTTKDLVPYLKEWIAYQNIITERFKTSTAVSLNEIEDYYERQYLQERREKGEEARSMLDVLDEIELAIKKEKSKKQIAEWINNLRKRSDIKLFK